MYDREKRMKKKNKQKPQLNKIRRPEGGDLVPCDQTFLFLPGKESPIKP